MSNNQKVSLKEIKDKFELKIDDTVIKNILKYEVSSNCDGVILKLELSIPKNEFNCEVVY
jgi:hypothetical protein|nr:MAG TPA: hypothetical protein [Caudoviricetes sp.]